MSLCHPGLSLCHPQTFLGHPKWDLGDFWRVGTPRTVTFLPFPFQALSMLIQRDSGRRKCNIINPVINPVLGN